jgi:hypothetical protein
MPESPPNQQQMTERIVTEYAMIINGERVSTEEQFAV